MTVQVIQGDCREVLKTLPPQSVDAVVTDPPYEWNFMGRAWDGSGIAYDGAVWSQCLRVLKPGGHLLSFGGPRTYHRLAVAIEDAGFEIRDSIHWVFGSGFPKSLDVSKAIDRAAGAERNVIEKRRTRGGGTEHINRSNHGFEYRPNDYQKGENILDVTEPFTEEARQWEGWGTALKPSHEMILVARKPFTGTVASNVLLHGTGALNIDGCRVPHDEECKPMRAQSHVDSIIGQSGRYEDTTELKPSGRWPSNLVLNHAEECGEVCEDGCPVAELDRQSGMLTSGDNPTRRGAPKFRMAYGEFQGQEECTPARGANSGGASRFFPVFRYEAKAASSERTARFGERNDHPTVKPVALMRWLVRLVTPPQGRVLDPFSGSGTTGIACLMEGFDAALIELNPSYCELIHKRLDGVQVRLPLEAL